MKMDMVRPCESCPFRSDKLFFLTADRAREIADGLLADKTFACHKTVDYDKHERFDEDPDAEPIEGAGPGGSSSDNCLADLHRLYGGDPAIPGDRNEQHCAGALIILEKLDRPNQWMRISERLGGYDRRKLDMKAAVFDDFDEFVDAMEAQEGKRGACRRRATAKRAAQPTSRATARRATAKRRKRS